ncbi:MAG TPA: cystathionine gamma-synthase family protein [Steroidobacteraceae bacterium]|jgi:methionine-gamma-lyase|nr:cystathionine gamma-synthase family protein [Steroidobacteraceae bacterium]
MGYDSYHKRKIGRHVLKPATQMMGYGYDPSLSEGSLKPPVFLTSTFVFKNAQEGKDFFDYSSGRREPRAGQAAGLVYSRFNNPNLEVLEDRLALWEEGEAAAVFSSGMAAISTVLWAHVRPGDVILMSRPLYGGTETLIEKTLPAFGVTAESFTEGHDRAAVEAAAVRASERAARSGGRVCLVIAETPANPTNSLVDLALLREVSEQIATRQGGARPPVAVDNTFLGPVFQQPLSLGADLVMYSLTKYVGGHSDLVAGGVVGGRDAVAPVKRLRGALGTQLDPNTAWMIMRSMETLSLRMNKSAENAALVAGYLKGHPKIATVNYLGFLEAGDPRRAVFERQCRSAGSTFGFAVKGGEAEAFRLLDALQVMKLAVSLGGTETLISHPASTTHSGVAKQTRDRLGITDGLIRISVGIEDADDLIADLGAALEAV